MKKHISLLLALLLHSFAVLSQQADTAGGYHLVWADEFDKDGPPDSATWRHENGFVRNHELQWYQPQNAWCRNGLLQITAKREHFPNPGYVPQSDNWKTNRPFADYTSSSINTRGRQTWLYGRFVMRARIDTDPGLWPAFWTLGVSRPWPSNGEIDIMEYYRGMLLANIACGSATPSKAKWFDTRTPLDSMGAEWSEHFHIWRMDWDKQSIRLYVDDHLLNQVSLDKLVNQDGSQFNPFTQPHYILLNLAIGGDNGGDPATTAFPKQYEIDYVRVYQQ